MSKLLSANFVRLKKDKVLWIGIILAVVYALLLCRTEYKSSIEYNYTVSFDNLFFNFTPIIAFFSAVFISLYIGTEYSDGTIRNRLVIGHARSSVYFSNLIVSTVAGLFMYLTYIAAICALGIPICGFLTSPPADVAALLLGAFVMIFAVSALFTMLSMLVSSKSVSAVLCLITSFVFFFVAMYIQSRLSEPEMYNDYAFMDSLGNIVQGEPMLNPHYISGAKRQIYEFLFDFLPSCQSFQIADISTFHIWCLPLYSLLIAAVTTVAGLVFFRGKDIK